MKKIILFTNTLLILIFLLVTLPSLATALSNNTPTLIDNKNNTTKDKPSYHGKIITPIPDAQQKLMRQYTWRPGCPVPLSDLALIEVSYWGFDQQTHTGKLIINKGVAQEVLDIFSELYSQKFPIALMIPMSDPVFQGSDDAAMAANNSSAFNCRAITNRPGKYSNHSYGLAIDINTSINPYVKGDVVLPPFGYINRSHLIPGMISRGDPVYNAFIKRGWKWGGDWQSHQDYQHFEKLNTATEK